MKPNRRIVIIGGTGLIGRKVASLLRADGNDVVVAAPSTGVNALTGHGLQEAVRGAEIVIDASNAPSYDPEVVKSFFESSSRNLAIAERIAKVQHHVVLSIVGADRMPDNGYFQGKVAQEAVVANSDTPYTIVRATQFLEFLTTIADASFMNDRIRLPGGLFQPIAADDVARFIAEIAVGAPVNGVIDVAGPECAPLDEVIRRHLATMKDARVVERDPEAKYFGGTVAERSLIPLGQARLGTLTHAAWFKMQQVVS